MRYLIVLAHPEPQSFNSALARHAKSQLSRAGHQVELVDLCAEGFDPVSDRRNFTSVKDPAYFKQQVEEQHATAVNGFTPLIAAEQARLDACDALILQFPLWWFGMPAILKGWVDRVFAMDRVYGGGKWYENGQYRGKRAMVSLTTGGPASMYGSNGLNPSMETILAPIQHGVLWFNGFDVAPPFITWGAGRISQEQRALALQEFAERALGLPTAPRLPFLPTHAFGPGFVDALPRWMVLWRLPARSTPEQAAEEAALRQAGLLVDAWQARDGDAGGWVIRASSQAQALAVARRTPTGLAASLEAHQLS